MGIRGRGPSVPRTLEGLSKASSNESFSDLGPPKAWPVETSEVFFAAAATWPRVLAAIDGV